MHRFFAELTGIEPGARVTLPQDEAAHASRVLRLRAGERVGLLDGLGLSAEGRLVEVGDRVTAEIIGSLPSAEPRLRVALYQGLPKLDKLDWVIQKSTELGVDRIVPVRFARCDARELSAERVTRGNKVSREASKQCGRAWRPPVEPLISFDELVKRLSGARLSPAFLLWEQAVEPFVEQFTKRALDAESVSIIIGPEGGVSEAEADRLIGAGVLAVSLGSRILRTETASLAALALMMGLSGDMG
ncbi:MAG: 16S rRNA (uracil(1498)-N(3))-methyltransferase [Oscillospiraceae bacterium]|nr:16S rRNA (uracil(1498)-N(3))-methyltransferase [Oscillospiraceae bacterium]